MLVRSDAQNNNDKWVYRITGYLKNTFLPASVFGRKALQAGLFFFSNSAECILVWMLFTVRVSFTNCSLIPSWSPCLPSRESNTSQLLHHKPHQQFGI